MRSAGQSSVIYMKKLRMKKNFRIAEQILVIIPFLIILAIISRTIPDGTVRLNIGESGIGEKAIALTFDDGPSDYTEELLDGLEEYEASVTFFVIGSKAEKIPDIVEKVSPSVVGISCMTSSGTVTGTGIIMSEDGYIITNAHVVDGASAISVVLPSNYTETDSETANSDEKNSIQAELIGKDTQTDIAVIKIEKTGLTASRWNFDNKRACGSTENM